MSSFKNVYRHVHEDWYSALTRARGYAFQLGRRHAVWGVRTAAGWLWRVGLAEDQAGRPGPPPRLRQYVVPFDDLTVTVHSEVTTSAGEVSGGNYTQDRADWTITDPPGPPA